MSLRAHRGTIFCEEAMVLGQDEFPGDQHILRLVAPAAAQRAAPGMFAHITCDASVPLRRPLSIMRASSMEGWLEFLYRPVGHGLEMLARKRPGDKISVLAPIGNTFRADPARPEILAIGGGVGIPPMIFLAEQLRHDTRFRAVVLMGSEVPFPFTTVDSRLPVRGARRDATAGLALLEDWGIASRLASKAALGGTYRGFVTELASDILGAAEPAELERYQLLACGPEPMLAAAARLAKDFGLPCELALEEYMACGVGGCAGCTVRVRTPSGDAMKRVCVDGPVFEASQIYPA